MWKFLFCSMIIPCNIAAMALVADYSNQSIVDDEIAQAIRRIKPASISDLIQSLKKQLDKFAEITSLDVSGNNIGLSGAIKLFEFVKENRKFLPKLESVNLSGNRIRYYQGSDEYNKFEKLLRDLITGEDALKSIAFGGNYLGIEWYNHMLTILAGDLKADLYEKIH